MRNALAWPTLIRSLCALSVALLAGGGGAAEAADGKALYVDQCSNCHGVVKAGARPDSGPDRAVIRLVVALPYGPTLKSVVGREAGTVPGYQYSRAFLASLRGLVWTRAALDRWITDTTVWVPGAIMVYRQPDPEIRARIIDYLERAGAETPGRRAVPAGGGERGKDARITSSAIRW